MSEVAKVKVPLAVTARSSPPLLRSTSPGPDRPVTVPPMVYLGSGLVTQVTTTVVTSAEPTVPEPLETVQVCEGPLGCPETVTE